MIWEHTPRFKPVEKDTEEEEERLRKEVKKVEVTRRINKKVEVVKRRERRGKTKQRESNGEDGEDKHGSNSYGKENI